MIIGTSLRFFFPSGPQTLGIYQIIARTAPPGAFLERPMGSFDPVEQAENLVALAAAARRANLWCLLVGDNHSAPPVFGRMFQPVPTIARLSAETGTMSIGMVLLAPFYHPLLLAEQIATISAFVDAPIIITFASGGSERAFEAFGYTMKSRGVRTEEIVPAVRALLAGETVTAAGRSFDLVNATISPLPRHPVQILIAGTNETTVERAGRIGDGWLTAQNATDAELAQQLDVYRRTAERHGRVPLPVLRRDIHLAASDREARAHIDPILAEGYRGLDYERLLVGSPDTIVKRLRTYESMGFDHVLVRHITGDHDAIIASFGLLADVATTVG